MGCYCCCAAKWVDVVVVLLNGLVCCTAKWVDDDVVLLNRLMMLLCC